MKGRLIRKHKFNYIIHLARTEQSTSYEFGMVITDEEKESFRYGLTFYSGEDTYDVEICYVDIFWFKDGKITREYLPLDIKLELL